MGHSASAEIVYGLDLGDAEYGEDFIELDDTVTQDLREDFAMDRSGTLEGLLNEFRGKGTPPPPYPADTANATHEEWKQWREATDEWAAAHPTLLGLSSYGYEFNGTVLTLGNSAVNGDWTPAVINPTLFTADLDPARRELADFLKFLDDRGVIVDAEVREPNWLLTSSYG